MQIALNFGSKIKNLDLNFKEILALCLAGLVCGPAYALGILVPTLRLRVLIGAVFLSTIAWSMLWSTYASSGVEFHSSDYTIFGSMFQTVVLAKVVGWNILYWAGVLAGIAWRSESADRAALYGVSALTLFVLSLAPTSAVSTLIERNLAVSKERADVWQFQNDLLEQIQRDNPTINLENARQMVRDRAFDGFPGYSVGGQ